MMNKPIVFIALVTNAWCCSTKVKTVPGVIRQRLLFVAVAHIMIAAVNPGREQDGRSPHNMKKMVRAIMTGSVCLAFGNT